MAKQKPDEEPAKVRRVPEAVKRNAAAVAVRDWKTLQVAASLLATGYGTTALGRAVAVTLGELYTLVGSSESMPNREFLYAAVAAYSAENEGRLPADYLPEVDLFLEHAYGPSFKVFDLDPEARVENGIVTRQRLYASKWLAAAFEEVVNDAVVDSMGNAIDGTRANKLSEVLKSLAEDADRINASVAAATDSRLFDDVVDVNSDDPNMKKLAVPEPTGVKILDSLMSGGERQEDVNIVSGPHGACKTLLAVYTCGERLSKLDRQNEDGLVFYISYETSQAEMQQRLLCSMAEIPIGRMTQPLSKFAKVGDPIPEYQMARWPKSYGDPDMAEINRYWVARERIQKRFRFLDFRGRDESLLGAGIPGLIMRINDIANREKQPIRSVWVDHLSGMADMMTRTSSDVRDRRWEILNQAPEQFRSLAISHQITVWLIHQLAGDAQRHQPTARYSQADFEGAKTMGKYASLIAFMTRPTEDERRLNRWMTDKSRHSLPVTGVVGWVDGEYQRVEPRPKYVIEGNQFVETGAYKPVKASSSGSSSRFTSTRPSMN